MNFFKLYIGDYQRDTGTLSIAEHGAYFLMLQHYYATEAELPKGRELYRLLRCESKVDRDAVDVVLAKFWCETETGYTNDRAIKEIRKADHQRTVNQEIGKRGGRPKQTGHITESVSRKQTESKTESVSESDSKPEPNRNPNQTPDTRQRHSEAIASGGKPPTMTADEIIFGYGVPLLTNAGIAEKQARSFLGGLRKEHGDGVVIDKLRDCMRARPLQPLEWLAAALPPGGGRRAGKQAQIESRNAAVVADWQPPELREVA